MLPGGAEVGSASLPIRSLRRPHSDDNVPQQVLDPCSGGTFTGANGDGPRLALTPDADPHGEVSAFHNDGRDRLGSNGTVLSLRRLKN